MLLGQLVNNILGFLAVPQQYHLSPGPIAASLANMYNESEPHTVVLGAGLIGLSTAYRLAKTNKAQGQPVNIVIIDPSSSPCAGASGQNEGVLATVDIPDAKMQPLLNLSMDLDIEMAAEHNGADEYGFRGLDVHMLFKDGFDPKHTDIRWRVRAPEPMSRLPSWLKTLPSWSAGECSTANESKKLDPKDLCPFLVHQAQSLGVQFLLDSRATSVEMDPASQRITHISIQTPSPTTSQRLKCHNLVLAAGSWTGSVYDTLFPTAPTKLPMSLTQCVQPWIRLRPLPAVPADSPDTSQSPSCDQIWLDPAVPDINLHISSWSNNDFFVGGSETPTALPSPDLLPEQIRQGISDDQARSMQVDIERYLSLEPNQRTEIVDRGMAYMPRVQGGVPLITQLRWSDLVSDSAAASASSDGEPSAASRSGVFVNTGHDGLGVCLYSASGLVMSELIMGQTASVDLKPFDLERS